MKICSRPARLSSIAAGAFAAIVLLMAGPVAAQWMWRDANGRVTASDLPPPRNVPDKDIIQRPATARRAPVTAAAAAPAASDGSAAPASAPMLARAPAVDKELEARKKAAEEQKQAKSKAEDDKRAAARAENCKRARGYMATLNDGRRIARVNDKGEREVLDDAARAEELRRTQDVITSECS